MDTTAPMAQDATASIPEANIAPSAVVAPALMIGPAPSVPSVSTKPPAPIQIPEQALAPAAVREDQVQNAVGFLSHPQVRSSTNTASKRSFLERKGLTATEIDEAFRRVPEAPGATAAAPAGPPLTSLAPQPLTQVTQPPAATGQQLALVQQPYSVPANQPASHLDATQPAAAAQTSPSYRWSQLVLGVGVVAAAGWAVHQLVVPRVRALVESWQAARREAEEARHKELLAAVEGLKGYQEELKTSTQALLEAVTVMREQQRGAMDGSFPTRGPGAGRYAGGPSTDGYYQNGRNSNNRYDSQYGNTSGLLGADNYAALRAAAGYTNVYPPDNTVSYNYGRENGPATAGNTGGEGGRGGAPVYGMPTPPYGAVRTATSGPYGSSGLAAQQQENLPYKITAPTSPTPPTHSQHIGRQAQAPQPSSGYGGMGAPYGSSDRLYDATASGTTPVQEVCGSGSDGGGNRTVPRVPPEQPVYPQSFHEVMEMVAKGITPPNVRTDINDTPPDPTRPLTEARMPAPPKPWERAAAAAVAGSSASVSVYGTNGQMGTAPLPPKANGLHGLAALQQDAVASPTSMPPTSYGMNLAADRPSSSGAGSVAAAGGSSSSLSVLPPVNLSWRPPPPPMRTVTSATSSSPSTSTTGMAGHTSSGGAAAAAPSGNTVSDSGGSSGSVMPFTAAVEAAAAAAAAATVLPSPAAGAGGVPVLSVPPLDPTAPVGPALSVGTAQSVSGADMAPSSPTPVQPPFASSGPVPASMPAPAPCVTPAAIDGGAAPPPPLSGGAIGSSSGFPEAEAAAGDGAVCDGAATGSGEA